MYKNKYVDPKNHINIKHSRGFYQFNYYKINNKTLSYLLSNKLIYLYCKVYGLSEKNMCYDIIDDYNKLKQIDLTKPPVNKDIYF